MLFQGLEVCTCAACAGAPLEPQYSGDGLGGLTGAKPVWTLDQIVGSLTRWDARWAPEPVPYTFYNAKPAHLAQNPDWQGFVSFSPEQRVAARLAMDLIADVANLKFVERPDDGTVPNGANPRLTFSTSVSTPQYFTGYALVDFAETSELGDRHRITSAELMLNAQRWNGSMEPGPRPFYVLMHEILHAVGLPHPANYNRLPNEEITYAKHAVYAQDSNQFTAMSYFGASATGSLHVGFAQTPLLHDVAALQALYGANTTTRADDTVYGYGSTAGRSVFDFAQNTRPIVTIWDAGGIDLLDFSQSGTAVSVDLSPGGFSDAFGMTNNIAIAHGVVIENARGGGGDDVLSGNAAANHLSGGAGRDTLIGGDGADRLEGQDGDDLIGGREGDDVVDGGQGRDNLFGDAGDDLVIGWLDDDRLHGNAGDDFLMGQQGNDFLDGMAGRDRLHGDEGDDYILGGGEDDTIDGGSGDDVVGGQDGRDVITGGAGRDRLFGEAGDDTISGQDGDDFIEGKLDDDRLFGNAGDDLLGGQDGADFLEGGSGNDLQYGDAGDDLLGGQDGADVLSGGSGRDLLYGDAGADLLEGGADDDRQFGGEGDDVLGGQDGSDLLSGEGGRDRLYGDGGDDQLLGGGGSDQLAGGAGRDRFIYLGLDDSRPDAADADRILDFDRGQDVIDISAIDADAAGDGDQAFRLLTEFDGRAGAAVLRYEASTNTGALLLDADGDKVADFMLRIDGDPGNGSQGFML